jgi:hypothetical protein
MTTVMNVAELARLLQTAEKAAEDARAALDTALASTSNDAYRVAMTSAYDAHAAAAAYETALDAARAAYRAAMAPVNAAYAAADAAYDAYDTALEATRAALALDDLDNAE